MHAFSMGPLGIMNTLNCMYGYLDIYIEKFYLSYVCMYFMESPTNANGKSNLIYPPFIGEGNKNILL